MEAAAILTLVSVGHWLEARMSTKAGEALKSLLDLAPPTARKLVAGGKDELEVPVATLAAGDRIALRPGDRVPVDAEVLDGGSAVDEGMLTGESLPVEKAPGASLFAGTVNQTGRLIARVRATGEATALANIIAAVQRAQSSRANVQRLAEPGELRLRASPSSFSPGHGPVVGGQVTIPRARCTRSSPGGSGPRTCRRAPWQRLGRCSRRC